IDACGRGGSSGDDTVIHEQAAPDPILLEHVHIRAVGQEAQEIIEVGGLLLPGGAVPVWAIEHRLDLDLSQQGSTVVGDGEESAIFQLLQSGSNSLLGGTAAGVISCGRPVHRVALLFDWSLKGTCPISRDVAP